MRYNRYINPLKYSTIGLIMALLLASLFVLDPLATAIEHAIDAAPNVFLMVAKLTRG